MAEYISRQKAIEAIMDLPNCPNGYSDTYDKACIIGMLVDVPTTDVRENVKGEWVQIKNESWECSVCHKENCYAFRYNDYLTDRILQDFFCPNCGADMRGEQDAKIH